MTDPNKLSKAELAAIIGGMTPSQIKKAAHADLVQRAADMQPVPVQPADVVDDSEWLTPTKVKKRAPRGPGPDGILIKPGDVQKEPRAGTKRALLLDLLRSTEGTTIDEIAAALGWRRDVASSALYVDVAASGYGVERKGGRLYLIGGK